MRAERNALANDVFPLLEKHCHARGARFHAVDLRNGISREAGDEQLTLEICLDEVRRCQRLTPRPNFIALLGDRYGWRPLPSSIEATEFDAILRMLPALEAALARQWYLLDTNSRPSANILRARADVTVGGVWEIAESALRRCLSRAARESFRPGDPRLAKYMLSATEHEILHGALDVAGSEQHVFAYLRTIEGPVSSAVREIYFDPLVDAHDLRRRQLDLRAKVVSRIGEQNTLRHSLKAADLPDNARLGELTRRVREHLQRVIDEELRGRTRLRPLRAEIKAHRQFGHDRREHFVGRKDVLDRIGAYLAGSSDVPLILWGTPGCGKSAVMAEAARTAAAPGARVGVRFIGATPASTETVGLLTGLCQEIRGGDDDATLRLDPHRLPIAFSDAIAASGRERWVLLLDGLDQLDREGLLHGVGWIPRKLPNGAKLIISAIDDEDAATSALESLRRVFPPSQFVELGALPEKDAKQLLSQWLETPNTATASVGGRSLTEEQLAHVLGQFRASGGSPLFLRLALDAVKRWRSFDGIPRQANGRIGISNSIQGLIGDLFDRLSEPRHHGPILTRHALGLLAAARHGVTETEILNALSNREVLAEFQARWPKPPTGEAVTDRLARRLPDLIWSRLHTDLEPYLHRLTVDGVEVLGFFHRQFRNAATEAFLSGADRVRRHRRLASCLMTLPHDVGMDGQALPSMRKLAELPFQLARAGLTTTLARVLGDLTFLEAKCTTGGYFDLMRDLDRARASGAEVSSAQAGFTAQKQMLRALSREIAVAPQLSLQSLHNVVLWSEHGVRWRNRWVERARLRLNRRGPWLSAAAPLPGAGRLADISFENGANVQAVSHDCSWLAVGLEGQMAAIRDLASGDFTDVRALPLDATQHLRALAIENGAGRLAWLTDQQAGCELSREAQPARQDETRLCWLPSGELVFVRPDGTLVAWDVDQGAISELVADLPSPLVVLDRSLAGDALLVVAGERRDQQQVYCIRRRVGGWEADRVAYRGPAIHDAQLGQDGSVALIASQDVSLKLLDLRSGAADREMFYERQDSALVRGAPVKCALQEAGLHGRAFVVTRDGDVAVWALSDDQMTSLRPCGHRLDPTRPVLLKPHPRDARVLLTTQSDAYFLDEGPASDSAARHAAEVDDCCLLNDGLVASVSRQDKTIRWWSADGLRAVDVRAMAPSLAAIRLCPDVARGQVLVGLERGTIDVMAPHEPESGLARQLFRSSVIGLTADSHASGVVGSRAGGLCRFNLLAPTRNLWLRYETESAELTQLTGGGGRRSFWTLQERAKVGGQEYGVRWHGYLGKEHVAWRGAEFIRRFAASPTSDSLAIAFESDVRVLRPGWLGWRVYANRPGRARLLAFLRDGAYLAVANTDSSWLEVWRNGPDLRTVAKIDLRREPCSMAAVGDRIVVGCRTGELASLRFEERDAASGSRS